MGWSCRADASRTFRAWCDACAADTGSSNVYTVKGTKFFFECDNVEHDDGAITGDYFRMGAGTTCYTAGTFRIEPDGRVSRGDAWMRSVGNR